MTQGGEKIARETEQEQGTNLKKKIDREGFYKN